MRDGKHVGESAAAWLDMVRGAIVLRPIGRRWCWLVAMLWAAAGHAGVLSLDNGDRISGELVSIGDGQVRWRSELFGEISVPQVNVRSIDARGLYEIGIDANRELNGCQVQVLPEGQRLNCEQGMVELPSWRSVERLSALPLPQHDRWRSTGDIAIAAKSGSGNVEEDRLDIDMLIELRRNQYRHQLLVEYDFQETNDTQVSDRRRYRYQFDLFINDRWFYNTELGWERDRFADLVGRGTVAVGLGYQFFDTDLLRLSLKGGPAYLTEHFRVDSDREVVAGYLATDFRLQLNALGLEFFHRNQLLQSFDQGEDWELETDTGLKLPIIGRLNAFTQLEYDYDNTPSGEAVSKDEVWSVGFSYDW